MERHAVTGAAGLQTLDDVIVGVVFKRFYYFKEYKKMFNVKMLV